MLRIRIIVLSCPCHPPRGRDAFPTFRKKPTSQSGHNRHLSPPSTPEPMLWTCCWMPATQDPWYAPFGRQKDRHSLQGSLAWLPLRALLCSMMAIASVLSPDLALYCPPLINVCPWPKASLVYLILGANIVSLKRKECPCRAGHMAQQARCLPPILMTQDQFPGPTQ